MHVGRDVVQHLGLQQQPVQAEPVDRVLLHDAHDARREVAAQLAEPAGDVRRAAAQPAPAVAVDRVERAVHVALALVELHLRAVGRLAAEHEPPALEPLVRHKGSGPLMFMPAAS